MKSNWKIYAFTVLGFAAVASRYVEKLRNIVWGS